MIYIVTYICIYTIYAILFAQWEGIEHTEYTHVYPYQEVLGGVYWHCENWDS